MGGTQHAVLDRGSGVGGPQLHASPRIDVVGTRHHPLKSFVEQVNRQLSSAILHMQRAVEDLSNRISDQSIASSMGQGGASSGDERPVRELARGVNQLVSQMRAEQKVVREWVDEQAAQQSDVASALRELAVNIKRRS